ncbi:MAG: hypothetical protein WCH46_04230 [bacterium]
MHLKSLAKRNWVEGWLIFAGIVIFITQCVVAKYALSHGGVNHTTLIGAPLDDTYIHCRYAENLLSGHGYSFNPGQVVSADTSPLWVVLIAFGGLFTNHLHIAAIMLSALAWLLLAPAVYRIARYVFLWDKTFSLMAAIAMLLSPRLLVMNLSGMETTLATLLVLIAVELHIRSREMNIIRLREAFVLACGIALRPEFYFLVVLVLIDWGYCLLKKKGSFREFSFFLVPIAISAVLVFSIPYFESGTLLYHSSIVQGAGFRFPPDFYYILRSYYILFAPMEWLSIIVVIQLFRFKFPKVNGYSVMPIAFMLLLPIVQAFVAPQFRHFGRYVFPLLPIALLYLVGIVRANILRESGNLNKTFSSSKWTVLGYVALATLYSMPMAVKWTNVYANSVSNINDQHIAVVDWVKSNSTSSDMIAADDVGALGYFTKRNLIDLTGLVSPEFYPLQRDQKLVWSQARKQGANLFIIYRRLNPTFYEYAKDSLELVKDFRVRGELVSSADTTLSIYRLKKS